MSHNAAALRAILAKGSKSFSLASHLLAPDARDAAAAVYAFCRRCDDAVDEVAVSAQPAALAQLRQELDSIYNHELQTDLALAAFAEVAQSRKIPREYPTELIEGMAMDVIGTRYRDLDDLLLYCYRVASVVGLMMCHVMGGARRRGFAARGPLGCSIATDQYLSRCSGRLATGPPLPA